MKGLDHKKAECQRIDAFELCYVCLIVPDSCNPIHCRLPDSSEHGILQARILQWLLFPSPWDLPDPGIEPGSPACRQALYWLSYKRSPSNWGAGEELRVPWSGRRSNQSILKEISPEYSLKGLIFKVKLHYFGHLSQLFGKDPNAGKE